MIIGSNPKIKLKVDAITPDIINKYKSLGLDINLSKIMLAQV